LTTEKKIFTGGISADADSRFTEQGKYLNLENMRMAAIGSGKNFRLENIPSTDLLYTQEGTKAIGTAVDYARLRLFWCVFDDDDTAHTIYTYDLIEQTTYIVLLSSQTESGFNWTSSYRIDRNMRIVGDMLIYTDNNNEPQCIDIEAGIKLNQSGYSTTVEPYATPIPYTTTTVIKRPPIFRLDANKIEDGDVTSNFIEQQAYQFCYRYQYKNYQYSVLSIYSVLIPYNSKEETFNAITVKLPFSENIDDYVQAVEICVRYGNTGKTTIIKRFDKSISDDATAISAHNANTIQLGITFYDDITPIFLDDITANTAFHDVSLKWKTFESAKDRLFAANVLKGYDTPLRTSLALTLGDYDTGGAGTYTADWKYFYLTAVQNAFPFASTTVQFFYAYTSLLSETSYYYSIYQSASAPASVNAVDADEHWQTETQLAASIQRNTAPPSGYHWQTTGFTFYDTGSDTDLIFTVDVGNVQFFKSGSTYNVSLTFYDRYRRKCGYVKTAQIKTPVRTGDQTVFSSTINWTLSDTYATAEIPDWAYYYTIDVSLNLTMRFFQQIWAINSNYANKNQDGTYSYTTGFDETRYAIAIDITPLYNAGMGYTFNEGDMCRVYYSDDTNDLLPVIGQDGNYILLKPKDISTLGTGVDLFIEIYTPYKPTVQEPLYETGDMLPILNPTTDSRAYGQTSGSINGDCYAIERDRGTSGTELYFVEAMSS
jgi:hypothetical protein